MHSSIITKSYIAGCQVRAAANSLSRGRRQWTSKDINQILPMLQDAQKSHPALQGEAAVTYEDLRTAKDARWLARRFSRLTGWV